MRSFPSASRCGILSRNSDDEGEAVTKADIIDRIAGATGLTKTDTGAVVDGFLSTVAVALSDNQHIEIRGFGTFKVVRRAPRTGRNPKTGETVGIPSRPVPVFKPSRELRAQVEKNQLKDL